MRIDTNNGNFVEIEPKSENLEVLTLKRYEAVKRTALDRKTWWVIWDNLKIAIPRARITEDISARRMRNIESIIRCTNGKSGGTMKQFCETCISSLSAEELSRRITDILEAYQVENPICDCCRKTAETLYILANTGKIAG